MRRNINRLLALLLTLILAMASIYTNVNVSRADENYTDDGGEDIDGDDYSISVSTTQISFGTLNQNTGDTPYQEIAISNTGSNSIELWYYISDAEKVFLCDGPQDLYLGPGQTSYFYIAMHTDREPGRYTGQFMAGSANDPDLDGGVYVDLSGTIVGKTPRITNVSVNPTTVRLSRGSGYQFSADVWGENDPDTSVSWTLRGHSSTGTYASSDGYVSIAPDEESESIMVVATSTFDQGYSDYGTINVEAGTYTVTTRANPSDGGNVGGGGTVTRGSDATVLASPNNGYTFVNWTVDGREVSTSPKWQLNNIKQNYDLVANFRRTACYVKVKANHPEGGSVTDSMNVNYGGSVTLYATPKSGFSFEGWYENNKKIADSKSINLNNITTNREITANFVQDVFTIKTQVNPSGCGVTTGDGNYKKGSDVKISAKPVSGYEFVNWTCNNNVISNSPEFTLTKLDRDCVLTANFQSKTVKTYEISAVVASGKGTISPVGVTKVAENGNMVYTFAPANGYVISAIAVDGVQKGADSMYAFKNITSNHTIAVAFAPRATSNATKSTTGATPAPSKAPAKTMEPNLPSTDTQAKDARGDVINGGDTDNEDVQDAEFDQEDNVEPEVIGTPDVFTNLDSMTGVLQQMNITPEQAREYIRDGKDQPLLEMAAQNQFLRVTVHNDFANNVQETELRSYMDIESVTNMQDVVNSLLTTDEKMYVLEGNNIKINLSIFDTQGLETDDTKQIKKAAAKDKISVGTNFEVVLMKTIDGYSQVVTEITEPAKIVVNVPMDLRDQSRQFCVIRSHRENDGSLRISYLRDEDSNPDTITFSTDKFSSYAIGYVGGAKPDSTKTIIAGILITILIVAIIVTLMFGFVLSSRRKRKHHKMTNRK